MGEAPAFVHDDLQNVKCKDSEAEVTIQDKTYVIGSIEDGSPLSLGVRIFDKVSGNWVTPVVLGTEPKPCKGYAALSLNDDRILFIKKRSEPDDCVWFLEVDSQYVREQKRNLGAEVVAWSRGVIGNSEKPIVISGPSGVGKGTLISMLMKEFPSMFGFSVSHTTRSPRNMEKDKVHYHFTDRSVMEKEIKDGKFLEFASVHGNLYGTSIEAVEVVADDGKRCILDIDVQGARSVKASSVDAIFIFVCPPSMEELEKRLRSRGTEAEEQILKRLRNAKAEIDEGKSSGIFEHILLNDSLQDCYEKLKKLLGLDGTTVSTPNTPSEGIVLPEELSISKIDSKILINCGRPELEKSSNSLIVLDTSSLKGGFPGRTRGLHVYAIDSFSDGLNEIKGLS